MRKAAISLMLFYLVASAPGWADCRLRRGQHVVLYSTTDDPSVLAWDSRARLREYHGASFDEARAMLPHALLISAGTHAIVVSCSANFVDSPLFHAPDDAIGVVITGREHGVTRWVLGSDVRQIR